MKLWRVVAESDEYDCLMPVDPARAAQALQTIRGEKLAAWDPLPVRVIPGKKAGDFPSLANHAPVFRPRAWRELQPILQSCGQLLPLVCDEPLFLFNVYSGTEVLFKRDPLGPPLADASFRKYVEKLGLEGLIFLSPE